VDVDAVLGGLYELLAPHLTEKQRRLLAGAAARTLGRGGGVRIEHRLFSAISVNWRGRPLVSHEVIVALIAATTTQTGLTVHAELDQDSYPPGVKASDKQLAAVPLVGHDFHGEWNYTITPPACGCSNTTTVGACS
jgi:hypothetical protein